VRRVARPRRPLSISWTTDRRSSSTSKDHDRCAHGLAVHVLLLDGARGERFIKTEQVKRRALAQANSDARRVYVFWDRVGPSVDHQAVAHGDALGLLIAHELGHVLLPSGGHSARASCRRTTTCTCRTG